MGGLTTVQDRKVEGFVAKVGPVRAEGLRPQVEHGQALSQRSRYKPSFSIRSGMKKASDVRLVWPGGWSGSGQGAGNKLV